MDWWWLYRVALPMRRAMAYRAARRTGQQLCKICGRCQDEIDFSVGLVVADHAIEHQAL